MQWIMYPEKIIDYICQEVHTFEYKMAKNQIPIAPTPLCKSSIFLTIGYSLYFLILKFIFRVLAFIHSF